MPGPTIAAALRIDEGQPVWEISRRRLLAGTPVILERGVMPLSLVPSLDDALLSGGGSLYDYLGARYGLVDAYEEQYLEVTVPSREEREALQLPAREQVVAIRGVSFDESGTPFDAYQQVYPARRFAFYVSGSREHRLLQAGAADEWAVTGLPGA
jgi:GntR family transcriptional regulator